jgi:hypothetical protein
VTTAAVLAGIALAVAGPDLVTVADVVYARNRGRALSTWWLVAAVGAPHAVLGLAYVLSARGVS